MKYTFCFVILLAVKCLFAWDTIGEMETDLCKALGDNNYLLSVAFSNKLSLATNSSSVEMKTEAYIISSIISYQKFLDTVNVDFLRRELLNASNAVVSIGYHTNSWQYWMSRFIYASAHISNQNFAFSYAILTNAIDDITKQRYTNDVTAVEAAILKRCELTNLNVTSAMKVFAGLSAAQLGMGCVATNFANQVPADYKVKMLEFMK